jgi:protein translocase SEC61 complex gamma subunit
MAVKSNKFETFILNSKRVFATATKPTRKEYNQVLKICLIGMAIIGGLSYIVQLIFSIVKIQG